MRPAHPGRARRPPPPKTAASAAARRAAQRAAPASGAPPRRCRAAAAQPWPAPAGAWAALQRQRHGEPIVSVAGRLGARTKGGGRGGAPAATACALAPLPMRCCSASSWDQAAAASATPRRSRAASFLPARLTCGAAHLGQRRHRRTRERAQAARVRCATRVGAHRQHGRGGTAAGRRGRVLAALGLVGLARRLVLLVRRLVLQDHAEDALTSGPCGLTLQWTQA